MLSLSFRQASLFEPHPAGQATSMIKLDSQGTNFKIKLRERNIAEDRLTEDLKRVSKKLESQKITAIQYTEEEKQRQKSYKLYAQSVISTKVTNFFEFNK